MRCIARVLTLLSLVGAGCGDDGKPSPRPPSEPDAGETMDAAAPREAGPPPPKDAGTDAAEARDAGGIPSETPDLLSAWNLFDDLEKLVPIERVVPYDMRSPLFTDYAAKRRFIYLPKGKTITYTDVGAWQFPVGSILIKHFSYPLDEAKPEAGERSIETRLLIHREEGWDPEVYVWNAEQTDAKRDVTGEVISVTRKAPDGMATTFDYGVPSRSECRKCHGTTPAIEGAQPTRTLGPMTGQLNMDHDYGKGPVNQIDHFAALGFFDRAPPALKDRLSFPLPTDTAVPVSERARAYLQANCAHCHGERGEVFDKQLSFDWVSTAPGADPFKWGVCKQPTSAGNAECTSTLDIVPGDPDNSLLVCRMESLGKGKMAPLGRNLVHKEGVALIREWIAGLTLPSCAAE